MFKKDEYIVCLEGEFYSSTSKTRESKCAKLNYVVKQFQDCNYLRIYRGWRETGQKLNDEFTFDKSRMLTNWRYATPEEAEEYERLGHPYDVTTLKPVKPEDTSYLIEIFAKNNIT